MAHVPGDVLLQALPRRRAGANEALVAPPPRPVWKAAVRQQKKIEAKRTKVADADADADHRPGKKLMVSTRWQLKT